VRTPGEDVRAGETILDAGTVLGPGQLAAAAALGMRDLMVHPRPRVAVLPTGDEIRSPGEPLGAGQIYDAVSAPLALLIREVGALALPFGPAPDEPRALAAAVREAGAAADAVVTIGGVSVGPMDLICRLPGVGDEIRGFRLALRPAKPFAFGRAFGVPLFGLPGNPGAALVAFEELVRPALLAMLGKDPSVRPAVRATLAEPLVQKAGRLHLVRAEVWREGGRLWARAAGDQGAAMIHSLARAQAWAAIPPDIEELPAGAEVQVRLLVDVP
jgi:molybdopterin molybdotransferase